MLSLALYGYATRQLFSFAEYFDKNRGKYNQVLEKVEEGGEDLTEFVEFFAEGLASEMEKLKDKVRRLSTDYRLKEGERKQIALTERQIALMGVLEGKGELTMTQARSVLPMVSDDTILRDLKALVTKKLVKRKGTTKGARYTLK